ncbi:MAG: FecR domain-containing protein [Planctomycetota bacterium]
MTTEAPNNGGDYLYDRAGIADPTVERLESLLAPLRHDGRPLRFASRPARRSWRAAASAAVLLFAVTLGYFFMRDRAQDDNGKSTPAFALRCSETGEALDAGAWVVAGAETRELELDRLGRITLSPATRLQLRTVGADETLLYLERGEIHATVAVDARPRFFQVETDAARCVDLGCRYSLSVDASGDSFVRVELGRVAFEHGTREVYVPAGAECRARKGVGAGTPRFVDAPSALVRAFDHFDSLASAAAADRRDAALAALNAVTSDRDTLSAWHLLQESDAGVVRAALAKLATISGRPLIGELQSAPVAAAEREDWKLYLEFRCW